MNKKTVAVIFGGQSTEHEVSRTSASNIIANMDSEKYFILPVGITKAGKWLIYNGPVEHVKSGEWEKYGTPAVFSPDATHKCLLKIVGQKVKEIPVDVVFPVLHGLWGEDGTIQGLLELSQVPYVGCGVLASSICMDKVYTKLIAKEARVPQAKYLWFRRQELRNFKSIASKVEKKLGYPCFVKPSNAGSSVGISKVKNPEDLKKALYMAARVDRKVIVEEFIAGREMECSVLGNENPIVSGVGEIQAGAEFYDYDAKYNSEESKTIVPADLPEETVEEMRKIAKKVFLAVDGAGMARVDFFIRNDNNQVLFNEINSIPGFTSISMYPMLWEEKGKSKKELIDELITLALTKENSLESEEE